MTLAKRLTSLLTMLALCHMAAGQNVEAAIKDWTDKLTPERAYLHYDKSAYWAGETIWFKAYLMTEVSPASDSKTLYVDWLDDKGALIQHSVTPILDAVSNGQFDIPDDYHGKFIRVRVYTKWMLNFDSSLLYNKNIRILSRSSTDLSSRPLPIPTITFFPEGGDAVAGVPNRIAFKANDQWGRPVRARGIVVGNDGKMVDSFRVIHDGMGYVIISPTAGASYTAKWRDEKNVEHTTPLPAIKQNGVAMQVTISGNNRALSIYYSHEFAAAMDTLNIVGTMYQRPAFRIAKSTSSTFIKLTIPTVDLPSGILIITVFDKTWKPIAERITFINNGEYEFKPELEVQHWGLNRRARNELKITIPDSLAANMSLSVTDAAIERDSGDNIISHLLMTSEIKGDINNPAYYFADRSDSLTQQLDLVMLTHGWRRFKWNDVLAHKIPKPRFERDTSYLSISGKIYGVTPGQILPGTNIILLIKQKDTKAQFLFVPVKPDGTFNDPSLVLFDTAHIYYQFEKTKGLSDASVQFMPGRLPAPSLMGSSVADASILWLDTSGVLRQTRLAIEGNEIASASRVKTLENVTVTTKTKSPVQQLDEKYASGLFTGDAYQFDLVNDPIIGGQNIFSYLQGKVAGLQVDATANPPTLSWRGGSPQLFVDEVPTDPDFVSSININDVAYIKVFRPPFMGGFNSANGGIAIYTRKGNDVKSTPGKGLNNNKVYGYSELREFYSPNYGSFKQANEQRDVRTTLYWNPAIVASPAKREIVITFYNNDVTNGFRVVLEGMTRDGRLAHIEQTLE